MKEWANFEPDVLEDDEYSGVAFVVDFGTIQLQRTRD
jgi:hypothetical protein